MPRIKTKTSYKVTYITDTEAKRGPGLFEETCPVEFAVDPTVRRQVDINWGFVKGVRVHERLLVKALQALGYEVKKRS